MLFLQTRPFLSSIRVRPPLWGERRERRAKTFLSNSQQKNTDKQPSRVGCYTAFLRCVYSPHAEVQDYEHDVCALKMQFSKFVSVPEYNRDGLSVQIYKHMQMCACVCWE